MALRTLVRRHRRKSSFTPGLVLPRGPTGSRWGPDATGPDGGRPPDVYLDPASDSFKAFTPFSQAADFYDSVGVVHHNYDGYEDATMRPAIMAKIQEIGFRHIRASLWMPNMYHVFADYQKTQFWLIDSMNLNASRSLTSGGPAGDGVQPFFTCLHTSSERKYAVDNFGTRYTYEIVENDGENSILRTLEGPPGAVALTATSWQGEFYAFNKTLSGTPIGWGGISTFMGPNEPGNRNAPNYFEPGLDYGVRWVGSKLMLAKSLRANVIALDGEPYIDSKSGRIQTTPARVNQLPVIPFLSLGGGGAAAWTQMGDYTTRVDSDVVSAHEYWQASQPIWDHKFGTAAQQISRDYNSGSNGGAWGARAAANGTLNPSSGGVRFDRSIPLVCTEFGHVCEFDGYPNSDVIMTTTGGRAFKWALPAEICGEYLIQQLVQHYLQGYKRSYIFCLTNEGWFPAQTSGQLGMGLLNNDASFKPNGHAIKNLLGLVGFKQGPDEGIQPISIPHTFTGGPDTRAGTVGGASGDLLKDIVMKLVLRRSVDEYIIILCRQRPLWGRATFEATGDIEGSKRTIAEDQARDVVLTLPTLPAGQQWTTSIAEPAKNPIKSPNDGLAYANPTNGQAYAPAGVQGNGFTQSGNQLTVRMGCLTRVVKIVKQGAPDPTPQQLFTPAIVASADQTKTINTAESLGASRVRVSFDINTAATAIDSTINGYAAKNTKVIICARFDGRAPTQLEAENLGTWASRFGPGGTFWNLRSDGALAVQNIEFGHETSYGYQYGDDFSLPSYATRAQNYATRLQQARNAIVATGRAVGLLCQAEDGGSASPNWVDNMYIAVPNLHTIVSGWTVHPYGPGWEAKIDRLISQTAAKGAPATVPIDITSVGIASDNGNALADNLGWPVDQTYDQAGTALDATISSMLNKTTLKDRLRIFAIREAYDLSLPGANNARDNYFGVLTNSLGDKGTYSTAVRSLFGAAPPLPPPPPGDTTGIWRGVAVAGGSFGDANPLPNVYGAAGHVWDVDGAGRTNIFGLQFLRIVGITAVRLDFRWENLQPTLNAAFDTAEKTRMHAMFDACKAAGLYFIPDVHNYGHRKNPGATGSPQSGPSIGDATVPLTAWQDFWRRFVAEFGDNDHLLGYELMNEPVFMTGGAAQSHAADQAALDAIRETDTKRYIWADGYGWAKVDNWEFTNGAPWLNDSNRVDVNGHPLLRYAAHHYFDTDADSNYQELPEPNTGQLGGELTIDRMLRHLHEYTDWLVKYNLRGAITEVGWPNTTNWNAVAEQWFDEVNTLGLDVLTWATGAAWRGTASPPPYELRQFAAGITGDLERGRWDLGDQIDKVLGPGQVLLNNLTTVSANRPVVVPSVGTTPATLRLGTPAGARLHLKGMNVWGLQDPVTTSFGSAQYQNRNTVVSSIKAWGANLIRFRILADTYNGAPSAASGQLTKAQIIQQIKDWRDAVTAQGLYFMPCSWDALDGAFSDAAWAGNGFRVHQMFSDIKAALGDDPLVMYEPTNEPNTLGANGHDTAAWDAWQNNMQASILHFREVMGYKGVLVIDPLWWANSGPTGNGYDDTRYTALETYDAARAGMGGKHQLVFAKHDYANNYSSSTWSPSGWQTGIGGSQIKHLIWENEFGNFNGPSGNSDTWSAAIAPFLRDRFATQQNFVGGAPFLWGPWFDANALTGSNNVTPTTPWGDTIKNTYFGTAVTPPPPSTLFAPGVVGNAASGADLVAGQNLGAKVIRLEWDIGTATSAIDSVILAAAQRNIKVLMLAGFSGFIPSTAQAQSLASWANRYAAGGSFWAANPTLNAALAVTDIEFGNETSFTYQYTGDANSAAYIQRAKDYAARFKDARIALNTTGKTIRLLCQGEDGSTGSPNWVNNMFIQVPELASLVGGWVCHPYGPLSGGKLDRMVTQLAARGAPTTIPFDITEYGIATDNGRAMADNYNWPVNLTYAQAASTLTQFVTDLRNKTNVNFRLRHFLYYRAQDLRAPGFGTPPLDKEWYFGALTSTNADKGAYSPAIRSIMAMT